MSKQKAYSYIRMSTEVQLQGDSLRRQLSMSEKYAKEHHLDLIKDMRDIGLSAYTSANIKKGELGLFINAVKQGEIEKGSILLVESLDRLSRAGIVEAFSIFLSLVTSQIEIHILSKNLILSSSTIDSNPYILNEVMSSYLTANNESKEKSRRISSSWSNKRDNIDKEILTTQSPFWLSAKNDRTGFDIVPIYAEVVIHIFDLYINKGMGAYRITNYLNSNHNQFPPPPQSKNGWSKSTILKTLKNPAVHGEFTPHTKKDGIRSPTEDVLTNYYPSIINEKVFMNARIKSKERLIEGGGRTGSFSNIFTKKIVCGHCGGRIHYQIKDTKNNTDRYLRCYTSQFSPKCCAPSWSYDEFVDSFFKFSTEFEFKEMIQNTSVKAQQISLQEKKQRLELEIQDADDNFNRTLKALSTLNSKVLDKAKRQLTNDEAMIDALEDKLSQVSEDLIKLANNNNFQLTEELQLLLRSHTKNDINSSADIREKIANQIKRLVDEIIVFNKTSTYDKTTSLEENISPIVLSSILKSRQRLEVERFMQTSSDQKLNKLERYYKIRFKNGYEKTIHPSIDTSYKFNNQKMNSMIFNAIENSLDNNSSLEALAPRYKRKKRS